MEASGRSAGKGKLMRYHSANELDRIFPNNTAILDSAGKTEDHLNIHKKIIVAISGGSDSDIMMDMIERLGYENQVIYVFYNTGLEYEATKLHVKDLSKKYNVEILEFPAKMPIPISCRQYGQPFLSKKISDYIGRLQNHGFKWEDEPFDVLYDRYPKCKAALRWWCNEFGEKSQFNIERHKWLKEFMVLNQPNFLISHMCCEGAKKSVGDAAIAEIGADLLMTGVRKSEGGARSTAYSSCFSPSNKSKVAQFRPLFYLVNADKEQYDAHCNVCHSECYTKYGLKRTGCACCPFGKEFEKELEAAKAYEPKLYTAANAIFGKSYEYTRKYRAFYAEMKTKSVKEAP